MRKRISAFFPVLALCLVQLVTRANDIEPTKEFYTVVYAPKPIVLDGDLSEWSGVPVLADPKFAVPWGSGTNASPNYVLFEEFDGGSWSGPNDQTSAVQIAYDADNVYFGFVVTDDYHENMSGNAWNGDSIQLMIADAARSKVVALYNYALGGYEDSQGNLVPDPNLTDQITVDHQSLPGGNPSPGGDPACNCPTEAVIKRDFAKKKTTYEIKMPKGALGLTTLKGGPQFGLGMAINDGDGALVGGVQYGQAGQEGQKGWGGLGAHSIVLGTGKTPSETALVTLAKGNDIEPGKEYYTALRTTNTIVLDGILSEWSGAPVLADPKFAVPKFSGTNDSPNYVLFEEYSGGTWSGPNDQTSAVQIVYDADNVYFGFVVTDDYHEDMSGNAWNGDSIQLAITDAARTSIVALYNYALGGYEDSQGNLVPDPNLTDQVIVNHEQGPGGDPACNCPTEAIVKRDFPKKKTTYEIKLPVASLGLTGPLTVGTQFGLGMAINDGDGVSVDGVQYGQAGQDGQKGWGGLGAHSIVFGKTASETALVTLGTTVSGSDRLFLSAVNPGIASFSFRATDKGASIVDPASAKLTIDGKVVTITSKKTLDATDFTYTAATTFPPNSAHTYSIEVKDTLGNTVTDLGNFKTTLVKIGLNFGADEPTELDPPGSALLATDVAGVPAVAQANWNNLSGLGDGTTVVPVLSDTGAGTSVTVVWDSNNTWASTGKGEENNQFTGADRVLMTGYLDTDAATTSHVTIAGIPDTLTAGNGYDLYVYLLGGVPGKGGGYRVLDSAGAVLKGYVLADANANPTNYVEVPQNLAAGVHGVGNYIVFKGLKAAAITLEATTTAPQGSGTPPRAPVNAVQLVPAASSSPPPPQQGSPAEFGQTVNGFQDDFTGATRDPDWHAFGPGGDRYEQADGILYVSPSVSDPNHLLYTKPGYSNDVQEVLARIRVTAFGPLHDYPRGGIAVGVQTNTADVSRGYNLHFRDSNQDNVSGRQFKLLDDARAWGPPGLRTNIPGQTTPGWTNNVWYWLRLRVDPKADGTNDLFGKVWLADGVTSEPADWQLTWKDSGTGATPKPLRKGFAGIAGSSVDANGNGLGHFEVDYILIKAAGLPEIKVDFEPVGPPPTVPEFTGITKLAGNKVRLEWIGAGTLEQADAVIGPWTPVPTASAVGIITISGPGKFYRLRQ